MQQEHLLHWHVKKIHINQVYPNNTRHSIFMVQGNLGRKASGTRISYEHYERQPNSFIVYLINCREDWLLRCTTAVDISYFHFTNQLRG